MPLNNKVSTTVKELCKSAGFVGKFTNHSLRASSASRMYDNFVPEQVIKEVTGHKSDCMRLYKHTSDNKREHASNMISGSKVSDVSKNVQKVEVKEGHVVETEVKSESEGDCEELIKCDKENMSVCEMIKNVIRTKMEIRNKARSARSKCMDRLAKRIVNRHKMKVAKRSRSCQESQNKCLVIDVNVNLNGTKNHY